MAQSEKSTDTETSSTVKNALFDARIRIYCSSPAVMLELIEEFQKWMKDRTLDTDCYVEYCHMDWYPGSKPQTSGPSEAKGTMPFRVQQGG